MNIRRLKLGEGMLYKEARLASLRDSPKAFASSYEDALERGDQSWNEQADSSAIGPNRATFLVIDEKPLGLGAIYRCSDAPDLGELFQMWVAPKLRGDEVATKLLEELFRWAGFNDFQRIEAEVEGDNARALRFYVKNGFVKSDNYSKHSSSNLRLTRWV